MDFFAVKIGLNKKIRVFKFSDKVMKEFDE